MPDGGWYWEIWEHSGDHTEDRLVGWSLRDYPDRKTALTAVVAVREEMGLMSLTHRRYYTRVFRRSYPKGGPAMNGSRESDWIARGFKPFDHRTGETNYTRSAGVYRDNAAGLRTFVTGECWFDFPDPDGDCHIIVAPVDGRPAGAHASGLAADETGESVVELVFDSPAAAYAALLGPG